MKVSELHTIRPEALDELSTIAAGDPRSMGQRMLVLAQTGLLWVPRPAQLELDQP
jgi:hypothetical protein